MLSLPQFVFINGPAECGKSTLAKLIEAYVPGCWPEAFAEPIREMIRVVFFPHEGPIAYTHDLKAGPVKKRNLLTIANLTEEGVPYRSTTVREAMIAFSQGYMKPNFGEDIFGRLLWRRCQDQAPWYSHFIIDDSGFPPEAEYIISQAGPANCALIRLHRNGKDFSGDSRGYIDLPIKTIDLHNDGAAREMLTSLQLEFGNI